MMLKDASWVGKHVLVTGHTGFKGGWLSLWLSALGADVHGYSLSPLSEPNFFSEVRLPSKLASSTIGDIRDRGALASVMAKAQPELVFHLAAQPLVRQSFSQPSETFDVNVMGLVQVLEAVRGASSVKAMVNVTSDKCYENVGLDRAFVETDAMGGHDPYSASKGCAELVTAAYRHSFMASSGVSLATARAGNVIGGGDWSTDRLIPDALRALDAAKTLKIRAPEAVRPWQHVLEPLAGYLALGKRLLSGDRIYADAWNFGPAGEDAKPVKQVLDAMRTLEPALQWAIDENPSKPEAQILRLDSGKSIQQLGWKPAWSIDEALERTLAWHRQWRAGADMAKFSVSQIEEYAGRQR